MIKEKMSNWYY